MKVIPTTISDLLMIELTAHKDARGFFVERFQENKFFELGLKEKFVQDNHSRSLPGVLRGLHYQAGQGKLVGVTKGSIWDVAVDLRPNSPTYLKSFSAELNDQNHRLIWIPDGFAHGFYVLGEEAADLLYKVTDFYNPQKEKGIRWDEPKFNISWPNSNPILSPRDASLPNWEA